MNPRRCLPYLLLLVLCLIAHQGFAQEAPPKISKKLVVATHPVAPFIIKGEGQAWSGISMDLWKQIAERLGVEYEVRELPVDRLLSGQDKDVDVVVSMNITSKSEATFDMTHAFYSTGLAIAIVPESQSMWKLLATKILTPSFLLAALGIGGAMFLAAMVMWVVERKRNPEEFGGKEGIVAGLMWAVETVIGYNDPMHRTRLGRAFGIGWALFGVLLISTLTAQLSSQLTVNALESSVNGPDDLPKVRVGTVHPSAGFRYCERRGLSCRKFANADEALASLDRREVDAVVYEAPILQYIVTGKYPEKIKVLPGTFDNHGYGLGLQPGSPLREPINRALLDITGADGWRTVLSNYLGSGS